MRPLDLNDQVRLKTDPKGAVFTVVGVYLDGEDRGVVLQVGPEKSSKGMRISRREADVVLAFPQAELLKEGA